MKGLLQKAKGKVLLGAGLLMVGSSAFAASNGNITMPTPNYTDFYAGVGVVIGVSLVVMLAKRLKSFFR